MSQGLSFESFAGTIDVDRDTIYAWTKAHKEFSDAQKKGQSKRNTVVEKIFVASTTGKMKNVNTAQMIFWMKNCLGWRDRHEVIDNTPTKTINLKYSIDE